MCMKMATGYFFILGNCPKILKIDQYYFMFSNKVFNINATKRFKLLQATFLNLLPSQSALSF